MRNRTMKLAGVLLTLTLISSCFVGGTFAKYTTSTNGTDNARVANWGFTETKLDLSELFSTVYDGDGDTSVSSTVDVIAPGTTGSDSFTFTYDEMGESAPEVAYSFVVSTDGSSCDEEIQNNSNIQWKLDDEEWGTWSEMIADIEAMDGDTNYGPGELPEGFTTADDVHTVYWRWLFDGSVDGATDLDTTDTAMGNASDLADVVLKITVTATQLDNYAD